MVQQKHISQYDIQSNGQIANFDGIGTPSPTSILTPEMPLFKWLAKIISQLKKSLENGV